MPAMTALGALGALAIVVCAFFVAVTVVGEIEERRGKKLDVTFLGMRIRYGNDAFED